MVVGDLPALPIIGAGEMFEANDAWGKIAAGASPVQVYTSLVFEGPGAAKSIAKGLRRNRPKLV
jgi:dihydroorotate dehydrogenase